MICFSFREHSPESFSVCLAVTVNSRTFSLSGQCFTQSGNKDALRWLRSRKYQAHELIRIRCSPLKLRLIDFCSSLIKMLFRAGPCWINWHTARCSINYDTIQWCSKILCLASTCRINTPSWIPSQILLRRGWSKMAQLLGTLLPREVPVSANDYSRAPPSLIRWQKLRFLFAERRPLKAAAPIPLFRSPSSRLNPRDIMEDDRGRSVDGLNLTASLEGPHNEAALHYSFMPNKQIVSFFICSHLLASFAPSVHPLLIIRGCLRANYLLLRICDRLERSFAWTLLF